MTDFFSLSVQCTCSGVWGYSVTSSARTPMRTIHVPSTLASTTHPPKEWRWPCGRPRQTWLRTVENDLKQQNLGLWSARHRAYDRDQWREIVETATLLQGHATW